jgi:hypothetical protein
MQTNRLHINMLWTQQILFIAVEGCSGTRPVPPAAHETLENPARAWVPLTVCTTDLPIPEWCTASGPAQQIPKSSTVLMKQPFNNGPG